MGRFVQGLSGRLLDLGGGSGSGSGGAPPWDLYGEGLSARLIDVGSTGSTGSLGLGIGVGLGGLGFAPPPPTAVPAGSGTASSPTSANGPGGNVQYRPWESKNHAPGTPALTSGLPTSGFISTWPFIGR